MRRLATVAIFALFMSSAHAQPLPPGNPPNKPAPTPTATALPPTPASPPKVLAPVIDVGDSPSRRLATMARELDGFCKWFPANPSATTAPAVAGAYKAVCPKHCAGAPDFCSLRRLDYATAVWLSDSAVVVAWQDDIRGALGGHPAELGPLAKTPYARVLDAFDEPHGTTSLLPTDGLVDIATTLLSGLAKLVVDRAKHEAIGWALNRLATDLCVGDIAQTWLPATCALAASQKVSGQGSGAALLGALRGALAADVQLWPSAAAGAIAGETFAMEVGLDPSACAGTAPPAECPSWRAIRLGASKAVRSALRGKEASEVLLEFGSALGAVDDLLPAGAPTKGKLKASACLVTLPDLVRRVDAEWQGVNDPSGLALTLALVAAESKTCGSSIDQLDSAFKTASGHTTLLGRIHARAQVFSPGSIPSRVDSCRPQRLLHRRGAAWRAPKRRRRAFRRRLTMQLVMPLRRWCGRQRWMASPRRPRCSISRWR